MKVCCCVKKMKGEKNRLLKKWEFSRVWSYMIELTQALILLKKMGIFYDLTSIYFWPHISMANNVIVLIHHLLQSTHPTYDTFSKIYKNQPWTLIEYFLAFLLLLAFYIWKFSVHEIFGGGSEKFFWWTGGVLNASLWYIDYSKTRWKLLWIC